MTNVKVTVTKEVAEAIEVLRSSVGGHNLNEYGIVTYLGDKAQRRAYPELNVIYSHYLGEGAKGFPLDLMNALVNGYTVEKSPEEIIREKYGELSDYAPVDRACKDGFRFVLDKLGIKIEGVNA